MDIITVALGVLLILVIGRNDGTPLVAISLRGLSVSQWWVVFAFVGILPVAPLLGMYMVAESYQGLLPPVTNQPHVVLAVLAATIVTIAISIALRAPNSITLALIGAATGGLLGDGIRPDWEHVGFVLGMAAIAPITGALVARSIPYDAFQPRSTGARKVFRLGKLRWPALMTILFSYSMNDGQKMLFVVALVVGISVEAAATSVIVNIVVLVLFIFGMLSGIRSAMGILSHGVSRATPITAVWSQIATSVTLVGGSLFGAPMSMTQTLQGSLLGSGLKRGGKAIRWGSVSRILGAWLWTLPLSGVLAFGIGKILKVVFG